MSTVYALRTEIEVSLGFNGTFRGARESLKHLGIKQKWQEFEEWQWRRLEFFAR